MSNPVHRMFEKAAAAGQRIQGGCESCDAYQTLEEIEPGVWSLQVHHADWCPGMKAMKAAGN
jgi:hypothetical protein